MSTIDDLRATLDQHAAGLHDEALHERTGAVRGRVRVVRRRRRAVAAAAVAAVVAVVAVGTSLVATPPAPVAGRRLAGHEAPRTMTSLGYTYSFARGVEGDGRTTLRLPASEDPVLLSWATSGPDDRVRLRGLEDGPRTVTANDFGDFVLVPPREGATVTLSGTGTVALAAYDLSRAAPGDTRDGITFREDVAGQRLLGDAIGEPGQADIAFPLSTRGGPLALAYLCSGGPDDAWLHVSLGGGQLISGGGCDDPLFDPGGRGGAVTHPSAAEAASMRLRMWVTHGRSGELVRDPDLRIALGAYAPAPPVSRLAGSPVTETRERDGHLWRLVDTEVGRPGQRELSARGVAGRETLVAMSFARTGRGTIRTLEDGRSRTSTFSAGGSGATEAVVPRGGGSVGLRATGPELRPDLLLGIARYVRAD